VGNDLARDEFDQNLKRISKAFETPEARRARGLAVFSSVSTDFFQCHALDVPVDHRLVVNEEPYLVPLFEALDRQRECLVVLADTHRGRIYAANPAGSRVLYEGSEDVPKHHRASGQRRGKEPGLRIERHRQEAIAHFQKELARQVEQAWIAKEYRGIILLGQDDSLGLFQDQLPVQLAANVIHQLRYPWTRKTPQIHEIVAQAVDEAIGKQRQDLLATLHVRLAENYRVAAGPQEVLDALRDGMAASILIGPDPGTVGSRCSSCGAVFANDQPVCSYCRQICEKANVWQQILTRARRHNVPAYFVKPDAEFDKRGAVAALLSRDY
jgi:peptide subunit release factor 1 (eRF1)